MALGIWCKCDRASSDSMVCCCLPATVPDGLLSLQREEEDGGEPVRLGDAGPPVRLLEVGEVAVRETDHVVDH